MTSAQQPTLMTYVPVQVPGVGMRVQAVPFGGDALEWEREQAESARRYEVGNRRLFYGGAQYEAVNEQARAALVQSSDLRPDAPMPEHDRLHPYSGQITESIDYLADRLGEGFTLHANSPAVQAALDAAVLASEQLSSDDDDGSGQGLTVDEALREALTAGDVAAYVGFDPEANAGAGAGFVHLWESEFVEFRARTTQVLDEVIRTQRIWVDDPGVGPRQIVERVKYALHLNPYGYLECRADTYWDAEAAPRDTQWLGVGRIPWQLLRCDPKGLRAVRGESLITNRVISAALRYDANESHSFKISRYNSHASVVAVGDAANLMLRKDGNTVHKDVADVVTFPDGTNAFALSLPTDPAMIEHQRKVLADQLYAAFGLTRLDQETIGGYGRISGYALEILNQKTESAHRRIRRTFRRDFRNLCSLILDVHAWWTAPTLSVGLLDDGSLVELDMASDSPFAVVPAGRVLLEARRAFWTIDPLAVFPDRALTINMGSGYVVDDVMIRDDVAAQLISKREGLRLRGYSKPQIDQIMAELAEEAGMAAAGTLAAVSELPSRTGNTRRTLPTKGVGAGGTLNDVQAPQVRQGR